MTDPLLVLVTGPPGTGKTTLARRLAADLRLPLVAKDDIKERLFDTLGWRDRAWSRRLGLATYELLYHFVETQLAAHRSLIAESNFDPVAASARLRALRARYPFEPCQVLCRTDGAELLRRFQARTASGERHPGHVDHLCAAELAPILRRGRSDPLDLGGTVFEIDTTDFRHVPYDALRDAIERKAQGHPLSSGRGMRRCPAGHPPFW